MSDSVDLLRAMVDLRPNGEHRPQQELAVEAIEEAIDGKHNLLVQAGTGTGKALDVETPILTTSGWKRMGDLAAGDIVFDEGGRQTTVLVAHEPFLSQQAYEVSFSDGSKIIADSEHLWATTTRKARRSYWREASRPVPLVTRRNLEDYRLRLSELKEALPAQINPLALSRVTGLPLEPVSMAAASLSASSTSLSKRPLYDTAQLLETVYLGALNSDRLKTQHGIELAVSTTAELAASLRHGEHLNHAVPVASSALQLEAKELLIEPYTLGAWLGDESSESHQITTWDADLLTQIEADGYFVTSTSDEHLHSINVGPEPVNNRWVDSFTKRLRTLGVYNNKHVPEQYLLASVDQRKALLSGLLDTDGYVDRNGGYEFSVTNHALATDVRKLVATLGYKASMREGDAKLNRKFISKKWTVSFWSEENYFKIERKRAMFAERSARRKATPLRNELRYITAITPMQSHPLVRCITVAAKSHLFLAGHALIPTHNTIGYLTPLIVTGKKAVISTATKQLSEQIIKSDIPTVRRALKTLRPGEKLNTALLKGRENYFCLLKESQGSTDDKNAEDGTPSAAELFSSGASDSTISATGRKMAREIKELRDWAEETSTGDRSDAPVVSDQIWRQHSVSATECVGRNNCPFGDTCFAERARDKARKAQIVVTNHAVVGHDLMAEEEGILGERDVYVFDELHELDNYLSNAWGTRLTGKMIADTHRAIKAYEALGTEHINQLENAAKRWERALDGLEEGLIKEMTDTMDSVLRNVYRATAAISVNATKEMKEGGESTKKVLNVLKKRADELNEATLILLDDSVETVRWKTVGESIDSLNAAPLRVGPRLQQALAARDAIMVGTSATITVAGSFDIPVHNLDLDTAGEYKTLDVGTPFDYKKQAMLYIPDPDSFPAPVGAERQEHSKAVLDECTDFVRAAGGRALVLSTTSSGAGFIARHLRKKLPKFNILLQGDAPNPALVEEFKKDQKSVLVATMGMWHGLDAPGPSLSLVIMDKVPFKPMSDPLSVARQNYADSQGRNGFMDVYVAEANVMLAQGAGRLIRSKGDIGVIAILDTRLRTKRYGKDMLRSLPPLTIRSRDTIIEGLKHLAKRHGD